MISFEPEAQRLFVDAQNGSRSLDRPRGVQHLADVKLLDRFHRNQITQLVRLGRGQQVRREVSDTIGSRSKNTDATSPPSASTSILPTDSSSGNAKLKWTRH